MPFLMTTTTALKWVNVTVTLTTAVATSGTLTVAYPSGTNQAYFTGNRATTTNQQVILNKNNLFTVSQVPIVYGASDITLTNSSGAAWAIGDVLDIQLAYADVATGLELTQFSAISGAAAAGACTLTGAAVGQRVLGVVQTSGVNAHTSFEGVITVANQIQQTSASDLSANKYLVLLAVDAT